MPASDTSSHDFLVTVYDLCKSEKETSYKRLGYAFADMNKLSQQKGNACITQWTVLYTTYDSEDSSIRILVEFNTKMLAPHHQIFSAETQYGYKQLKLHEFEVKASIASKKAKNKFGMCAIDRDHYTFINDAELPLWLKVYIADGKFNLDSKSVKSFKGKDGCAKDFLSKMGTGQILSKEDYFALHKHSSLKVKIQIANALPQIKNIEVVGKSSIGEPDENESMLSTLKKYCAINVLDYTMDFNKITYYLGTQRQLYYGIVRSLVKKFFMSDPQSKSRCILFYGETSGGKSIFAQHIAGIFRSYNFRQSNSNFQEEMIESQSNVQLLLIDEVSHETFFAPKQLAVTKLLFEGDGILVNTKYRSIFHGFAGCFVLLTTNNLPYPLADLSGFSRVSSEDYKTERLAMEARVLKFRFFKMYNREVSKFPFTQIELAHMMLHMYINFGTHSDYIDPQNILALERMQTAAQQNDLRMKYKLTDKNLTLDNAMVALTHLYREYLLQQKTIHSAEFKKVERQLAINDAIFDAVEAAEARVEDRLKNAEHQGGIHLANLNIISSELYTSQKLLRQTNQKLIELESQQKRFFSDTGMPCNEFESLKRQKLPGSIELPELNKLFEIDNRQSIQELCDDNQYEQDRLDQYVQSQMDAPQLTRSALSSQDSLDILDELAKLTQRVRPSLKKPFVTPQFSAQRNAESDSGTTSLVSDSDVESCESLYVVQQKHVNMCKLEVESEQRDKSLIDAVKNGLMNE